LILAAADYARGKGPPPRALTIAQQCEHWHALPNAGGIFDQPIRLMEDMRVALNVYRSEKAFRYAMNNSNIVKWQRQNPDTWAVASAVRQLRRAQNAR